MFLTAAELLRLTGKVRYSAQRRALDALGIPYLIAATGEPLVSEAAVDGSGKAAHPRSPKWHRLTA